MKILIITKGFDLTKSLKEIIYEQLKPIEKYLKEHEEVHVSLSKIKEDYYKAELMIFSNEKFIKTEIDDSDLLYALQKATKRLFQKLKEKIKMERSQNKDMPNINPKESDQKVDKPNIIRRKAFNMKPMMEDEAIMQMELLGHSFFMFFNAELGKYCVVYKRKHGGYGIIESGL